MRKFGLVVFAAFALTAIAAANASAGRFTSNVAIPLSKTSNTLQIFDVNNGGTPLNSIECNNVALTGNTPGISSNEQTVKVNYGGCRAFFNIITVNITEAEYQFTAADGGASLNNASSVHSKKTITINVGGGCNVVVGTQKVSSIEWNNAASGDISTTGSVNGIVSNGNGGACSTHSNEGTFNGNIVMGSNASFQYDKNNI